MLQFPFEYHSFIVYKTKQADILSHVEIYEENKRLNKLIEKNETFVHPDGDMEMQERIPFCPSLLLREGVVLNLSFSLPGLETSKILTTPSKPL